VPEEAIEMTATKPVDQYLAEIPPLSELRERLTQNVREANLLRKLIRLAEQRDKAASAEQKGTTNE
jgi:hypothetical protein